MPKFVHIPTALEYLADGYEPKIITMDSCPSDDWVEVPEFEFDPTFQFIKIAAGPQPVDPDSAQGLEFTLEYKERDVILDILNIRASNKHCEVLNSGITLPNGVVIDTGLEDRAIIEAMNTRFALNPDLASIEFKSASGWVSLPKAEVLGLYATVKHHIETCDNKLVDLLTKMGNASTCEDICNIFNSEIEQGWPTYV